MTVCLWQGAVENCRCLSTFFIDRQVTSLSDIGISLFFLNTKCHYIPSINRLFKNRNYLYIPRWYHIWHDRYLNLEKPSIYNLNVFHISCQCIIKFSTVISIKIYTWKTTQKKNTTCKFKIGFLYQKTSKSQRLSVAVDLLIFIFIFILFFGKEYISFWSLIVPDAIGFDETAPTCCNGYGVARSGHVWFPGKTQPVEGSIRRQKLE